MKRSPPAAAIIVAVVSAVAILSGGALAQTSGRHAASQPTLSTAPDLGSYGITLSAPPADATPAISEAAAANVATHTGAASGGAGATVREQVLATIDAVNSSISSGALVWAVSIMPPGGLATYLAPDDHAIPGKTYVEPSYPTGYYVVFVDAMTGVQLGAVGEGHPAAKTTSSKSVRSRKP